MDLFGIGKKRKIAAQKGRSRLMAAIASDVGVVRENNEDNFYVNGVFNEEQSAQFYYDSEIENACCFTAAVFDGMGGESLGELASVTAASWFERQERKMAEADLKTFTEKIAAGFAQINNKIIDFQELHHSTIGTTAVALCTDGNEFRILSCGDSRAYLIRKGEVSCLTQDHTVAALKIAAGVYQKESRDARRDRHSLISFLGSDKERLGIRPDETEWCDLEDGDQILLCSDGLTDVCQTDDLREILGGSECVRDKVIKLVDRAIRKGSRDNITCLLVMKESRG